jgi:hypothetical protein
MLALTGGGLFTMERAKAVTKSLLVQLIGEEAAAKLLGTSPDEAQASA